MDLREHPTVARFGAWVAQAHGGNAAAAGRALGCTDAAVHYLRSGKRIASLRLALAIERETATWAGGRISAEEWQAARDALEDAAAPSQQTAEPADTAA